SVARCSGFARCSFSPSGSSSATISDLPLAISADTLSSTKQSPCQAAIACNIRGLRCARGHPDPDAICQFLTWGSAGCQLMTGFTLQRQSSAARRAKTSGRDDDAGLVIRCECRAHLARVLFGKHSGLQSIQMTCGCGSELHGRRKPAEQLRILTLQASPFAHRLLVATGESAELNAISAGAGRSSARWRRCGCLGGRQLQSRGEARARRGCPVGRSVRRCLCQREVAEANACFVGHSPLRMLAEKLLIPIRGIGLHGLLPVARLLQLAYASLSLRGELTVRVCLQEVL